MGQFKAFLESADADKSPQADFIAFCVKSICMEVSDDLEELLDEYSVDEMLERAYQECGDDFSEYEGDGEFDADDFKDEILAGAKRELEL